MMLISNGGRDQTVCYTFFVKCPTNYRTKVLSVCVMCLSVARSPTDEILGLSQPSVLWNPL